MLRKRNTDSNTSSAPTPTPPPPQSYDKFIKANTETNYRKSNNFFTRWFTFCSTPRKNSDATTFADLGIPKFNEKGEIRVNKHFLLPGEIKKDHLIEYCDKNIEEHKIEEKESFKSWEKVQPTHSKRNLYSILLPTKKDEDYVLEKNKKIKIKHKKENIELKKKKKEILAFIEQMKDKNSINLKDQFNRNVIFIGNSKNGKSTSIDIMKSPFNFVEFESSPQTKVIELSRLTVTTELEDKQEINFNINLMDTPGVFSDPFAISRNSIDKISEEIIIKCIKAEITKIHAIFFVVPNGAVNVQDIEALEKFIKMFEGAEDHINILVTKCEKLSSSDKEKITEDFKKYPQMKDLLKKVGQQIYFTGAVELIDFEKGFVDTFKYNLNNVVEMREDLFNFIFQQETAFELNALHMVDKVRQNADELLKKVENLYSNKESIVNTKELSEDCIELQYWLPVLNSTNYAKAKKVLNKCGRFIIKKEDVKTGKK